LQTFAHVGTTLKCTVLPGSPLGGFLKASEVEKEMFMRIALAVAFGMVAVAPFFGRWRANVWLKKNMPAAQPVRNKRIAEAA
jgi:hypothetical protein